METSPSGEQWVITRGDHQVTVVEVGGGLRTYRAGGRDVLAGYEVDEMARVGRGQVLMPWPNRLRDGRYRFEGRDEQLALTEPARHNASHGLVRWALWTLLERSPSSLTVGYRLHPQPGWAGRLDLTLTYELTGTGATETGTTGTGPHGTGTTGTGLTVTATAENVGAVSVPFGFGQHPYVAVGTTRLEDVVLTVPASEQVLVDDERKLPTGTAPVTEGDRDFRQPRPLGATRLDTAFTDLRRDADGRWRVRLDGLADRPAVTLWADEAFGWVQVFTDHAEDDGVQGVRGIAVEPLSCPADAFNSGEGLVVLAPGERWSGQWGLALED